MNLVVLILLKEGQRFELWEATNLSSFQDYHHKPLGQPSNVVLKQPIRVLCCPKATIVISRWRDLNPLPSAPKAVALPNCATSGSVSSWTRTSDQFIRSELLYPSELLRHKTIIRVVSLIVKWVGLDLNQRRQSQRIYSPLPLTTRTPTQQKYYITLWGIRQPKEHRFLVHLRVPYNL